MSLKACEAEINFYSRPCGRGDRQGWGASGKGGVNFYSRPCGRGDWKRPWPLA